MAGAAVPAGASALAGKPGKMARPGSHSAAQAPGPDAFWTLSPEALAQRLACTLDGLTNEQAADRLRAYGPNLDKPPRRIGVALALGRRLTEPLALVLLFAAIISAFTGDTPSAAIIAVILILSIGLDTFQERRALKAAELLRRSVAVKCEVKREGAFQFLEADRIVPGDLVRVRSGDVVPADALVLTSDGFSAGEAALTGEPYPVEKRPGPCQAASPAEAFNALFRGAVAQTGEAVALVVGTGRSTLFGSAAAALSEESAPSPFQHDLRKLGFLVVRMTVLLVLFVLTVHMLFGRPFLQSLMFSAALAVGLTPELLPMITTVTLARGAVRMAACKVIVKRLAAIHDMGAMTVLCTDKTGTLTSAEIVLAGSFDPEGNQADRASRLAAACALLGGDRGALDAALIQTFPALDGWTLVSRQAFDFHTRVGSVVADGPEGRLLILKGSPEAVLARCAVQRVKGAVAPLAGPARQAVLARVQAFGEQGLRTVAVASALEPAGQAGDGRDLVLEGLCTFADPPKATAPSAIARLHGLGVRVKILSGDDPVVVRRLAGLVGLKAERILTGPDLDRLSASALKVQARRVDIYARLSPDQKSRLIQALKAGGEVVGFLGDGINDAPALKAADVGLSVAGATGVAREAADMILLESDLAVVADGVEQGRRTFVNIRKYVRMGASSNFGNMLSMAAASVLLPFLPMLPTQILLNNLIYDVSEVGLPFDDVAQSEIARPEVWRLGGIMRFAAIMGPLSSAFDMLTFAGLFLVFHLSPAAFRTGWFLESMATQILVIFLIRTGRPFWKDRPHPVLTLSSLGALAVALVLPFTPLARTLQFQPPPVAAMLALAAVVALYLMAAELLKRWAMSSGRRDARRSRPLYPLARAGRARLPRAA
jgi:Mg2+-importing ATPase